MENDDFVADNLLAILSVVANSGNVLAMAMMRHTQLWPCEAKLLFYTFLIHAGLMANCPYSIHR